MQRYHNDKNTYICINLILKSATTKHTTKAEQSAALTKLLDECVYFLCNSSIFIKWSLRLFNIIISSSERHFHFLLVDAYAFKWSEALCRCFSRVCVCVCSCAICLNGFDVLYLV